jgi:hypothetical protein
VGETPKPAAAAAPEDVVRAAVLARLLRREALAPAAEVGLDLQALAETLATLQASGQLGRWRSERPRLAGDAPTLTLAVRRAGEIFGATIDLVRAAGGTPR